MNTVLPEAHPILSRHTSVAEVPLVVFFVDGLPFTEAQRVIPQDWSSVPMVPGLGFSVNIKAELFAGKTAADLGWFCEWNPGERRRLWQRSLTRTLSYFSGSEHLDWVAHRVLSRIFREELFNVPLDCLHSLHRTGIAAYEDSFPEETVFDRHAIEKVLYSACSGANLDASVQERAIERLTQGSRRIFVPFVQLDAVSHRGGMRSEARALHLDDLRRNVLDVWKEAKQRHDGAVGLLVSDHGFADVTEPVNLPLGELLRRLPRGRRALYTMEATLARVWSDDHSLIDGLRRELENTGHGRVLDPNERETWHIAGRRFGDLVFLLDEGKCFVPNTMTKRTASRAMHGYDPANASQWGVAAASLPLFDKIMKPLDVFALLSR